MMAYSKAGWLSLLISFPLLQWFYKAVLNLLYDTAYMKIDHL